MSSGRFSRKLAVDTYSHLLHEYGAVITKKGKEQHSDFFEGTLDGKKFKFIVYHDGEGEFTKIVWQKVSSDDFQDIQDFFHNTKEDILEKSKKVKAAVVSSGIAIAEKKSQINLSQKMANMSSGHFSRKLAVDTYFHLLHEFGADITDGREQYDSDFFEGTLDGEKFKFIVYHDKEGEFTEIGWQVSRDDIKAFFDRISEDILEKSEKVKRVVSAHLKTKMRVKEEAGATP